MDKEKINTTSQIASIITVLIAFAALWFGIVNVNKTLETDKHLKAMDIYLNYTQRIEQEDKAGNDFLNSEFTFNEKNWKSNYEIFADYVLIVSENIYRLQSESDEWRKTLYRYMLYPHIPYYEKNELVDDAYSQEFKKFYNDSVLYYYRINRFKNFPDVYQSNDYICGASAVQSILMYYGIFDTEINIAKKFGTTKQFGTSPEQILTGFKDKDYDLDVTLKENTTLNDLQNNIDNQIPTMVAIQAWLANYPPSDWNKTWEDGHWVVVIGMDKDNVYFEDPSLEGKIGKIARSEFIKRWHDYTGKSPCCNNDDKVYKQLSITVKSKPLIKESVVNIE